MKIAKIVTSVGGPCIYKQGVLEDGRTTGRIQYVGQTVEKLQKELMDSLQSGRDDVKIFIDKITERG